MHITAASNFIEVAILGNEEGGQETKERLESLMLEGETIVIATGGDGGGALFTDRRLILVNEAGLFTKRSVVRFLRASAIDAVSIDASSLLEVKIAGSGFGTAHLIFDPSLDAARLARWFGETMNGKHSTGT